MLLLPWSDFVKSLPHNPKLSSGSCAEFSSSQMEGTPTATSLLARHSAWSALSLFLFALPSFIPPPALRFPPAPSRTGYSLSITTHRSINQSIHPSVNILFVHLHLQGSNPPLPSYVHVLCLPTQALTFSHFSIQLLPPLSPALSSIAP